MHPWTFHPAGQPDDGSDRVASVIGRFRHRPRSGRVGGTADVVLEPSAGGTEPWSCSVVTTARLEAVVALAVDGLADTSAQDGWSRACARLQSPDHSQRIGYLGTMPE